MVYDVTSAESFVNVKRWLHEINQNCDDVCRILGEMGSLGWGLGWRVPGVLLQEQLTLLCLKVGNKNDDPERKVVETEDAYKFAGQMGIQLFETSAKENVNVEEVRPGTGREWAQLCSTTTALLLPLACCGTRWLTEPVIVAARPLKSELTSEQSSQVNCSVSNGKRSFQLKEECPAR